MALEARALSIGFPSRTLGEGIEVAIAPGEVACLLGPNGSGKTTLMRTLLGLLPPLAGTVTLEGRALGEWSPAERARKLAYVPQASESYFEFSALEMVEMGRAAHRGALAPPGARDRAVSMESLERLGVAALADRPMQRLSGGERQLVLVARALATEAGCLLLDEPTAHLDFGNQARVLEEMARLAAAGHGVLFTTHAPDHALAIGRSAYLLRGGRMIAAGPVGQAVTGATLTELYGRRIEVIETLAAGAPRRICVAS
jgi:iron complex transport system ATP-binding protein